MRILIFIILAFTLATAAQTPLQQKLFTSGTENANRNEFKRALEDFRQTLLLAKNEKNDDKFLARVHFNIGVCFFQLKDRQNAAVEFSEAIKLSRRDYQKAFYALGMVHAELKNWEQAENAFRDALKINKTDGEAWFDLALVYIGKQNYSSAEKAFENAVKYRSVSLADAHNNLGVVFALKSDFDLAENEFKAALLVSDGKSIEARKNLQFCKYRGRNFNQNLLAQLEFSQSKKITD